MKVLVTGANGYLGRGIVKKLLDNGVTVIAQDFSDDFIDKRATIITGNLFLENDPFKTYDSPDVLLHLAWRDGFVHNSDAHMQDFPLHYEFLQKMIKSGVKRVAVMGSMHEIGFHEGPIHATTACFPMTLYGIAKNALRDAAAMMCKQNNVQMQWLRGFYIVANTSYGNSIFSKIVAAEQQGKETFPFTTGQNQYDFLNYEEFCVRVAAAVEQDSYLGIINICSGRPEKLAERVERFIKENGFSIRLEYGVFPDRAYDSKAVWGDASIIDEIIKNQQSNK